MAGKNKEQISDSGSAGKYFHIIYNMADDDLDVYEYRLYGHYKRVCGSETGACWESTRTTAEKCKMSVGKVAQTRRKLQGKGYIQIEERADSTLFITLIDRMAENLSRYSGCSSNEHSVHLVNANVHGVNARVHQVKQRRTHQKRTYQRRINKEKPPQPPVSDSVPVQEKLHTTEPVVVVDENPFSKNWDLALAQLEIQLDRGNFDTWLRGVTFKNCETPPPGSEAPPSPVYVIGGARNQIQVDMLQNRLYRTIRRIVSDVHGSQVELRFEITDPSRLPEFLNLPAMTESDEPAPEVLRAARQADVERLYAAYVRQPNHKDRAALNTMAQQFAVDEIEEAFKNTQFQHSRNRVNDPLGYAWGILRRNRASKNKYQPLGF